MRNLAAVLSLCVLPALAGEIQMPPACTTPDGMCVDPEGRLVIAAPNNARKAPGAIFRLDAPGGAPVRWFDVPAHPETGYAQPMGVCFGPNGELYVCDCNAKGKARLLVFTFRDGQVASCETVARDLDNANGVKYWNGKLYVTVAFLYGVKRGDGAATSGLYRFNATDRNVTVGNTPADPQCVFSDVTRNPKVACGLNGVAIDSKGTLYVDNYGDGRIWKFRLTANGSLGRPVEFVKSGVLKTPDGLCVDTEDNLYVADMQGEAAAKVSPKGEITFVRKGGFVRPSEPCVWQGRLYVANYGATTLAEIAVPAVEAKDLPLKKAIAKGFLQEGAAGSSFTAVFNEVEAADAAADAAWRNLKSRAEYDAHRAKLHAKYVEAVGGFPSEKCPLNAKVVKRVARDGYRAEKVIYESLPGVYVTGLMFLPDPAKFAPPYPAYLIVCGHSGNGKGSEGYQRGCVMGALAGMASMIIDPIGQGERRQIPSLGNVHGHNLFGVNAMLVGQSMARYRLWDAMRALDYFTERPDLRHDGYGVMGNSGGGTMSSLLCAMDPRIVAAAPCCYLSSIREVCRHDGPQDAEQNIFGQLAFGLNHAGFALTGGNAVRIHCCHADFFPFYGTCETWRTVSSTVAACGLGDDRYGLTDVPGPHGWKESTRASSVQWMRRWLMGQREALPIDVEACRRLDVGFDIEAVPYGFAEPGKGEEDYLVTPEGEVSKLPGFRNVYDYLRDALDAALAARKPRTAAETAAVVRRTAGIRAAAEVGAAVKDVGSEMVDAYSVSRLAFHFAGGLNVSAVVVTTAGADKAPVLLLTDTARGDCAGKAAQLLAAGHPVMLADLLASGEIGAVQHRFYGAPNDDEEVAVMLYWLGKSLVGVRAEETLALVAHLKDKFGAAPTVVAKGRMAIPAAHAFAAEPGAIAKVETVEPPSSWADCVRNPVAPSPFANAVHGGLLQYDWVDLLETR